VRLPLNRQSAINKVNKAILHLEQKYECEPTDDEIAEYLEITRDEVHFIKSIKNRQVSFDKPLSPDDNNGFNLYDIVQTGNTPAPDHIMMNESVATDIKRALNKLPEREASVIILSFGLNKNRECSLHDIAEKFKISAERVRQIKLTGLSKLKHLLKEKPVFTD
jgi:RNA polymerase primary sigma factor